MAAVRATFFNTAAPHQGTKAGTVYLALRYEPIVAVGLRPPVTLPDSADRLLTLSQINQRLFRSPASGGVKLRAVEVGQPDLDPCLGVWALPDTEAVSITDIANCTGNHRTGLVTRHRRRAGISVRTRRTQDEDGCQYERGSHCGYAYS